MLVEIVDLPAVDVGGLLQQQRQLREVGRRRVIVRVQRVEPCLSQVAFQELQQSCLVYFMHIVYAGKYILGTCV